MFTSLIVYIGTALILFALGKHLEIRERRYWLRTHRMLSFWQWEVILSILVFGVIAGARYNTGVDHLSYLTNYEGLQRGIENYRIKDGSIEIGYIYLTRFFAQTLNAHYFYYFAFLAMMQIGFVYYALKDKKYLLPIVGAAIMMGSFFLIWMNIVRQVICSCCFVFLVNYIVERKPIHYIVWVLICTLMHKSALLLLPFYFIYLVKLPENRVINLSILGVCVFVGLTPTWIDVLSNMGNLLEILGYDGYAEKSHLMLSSKNFRETAWGPSRLGLFLVDVFIIWLYSNTKKYFKDDKFLEYSFVLFFIGSCAYNLFANTSHIFLRPIMFLSIFNLVVQAYTLLYLFKVKRVFMFYLFAFLMFYYAIYVVLKSSLYPSVMDETNLYHFFFDYNPIYKYNILK
jgi:hypothetical protein